MARRKRNVVPPRVSVQTEPPRRILWAVVAALGLMLVIWFSYEFGHNRSDGGQDRDAWEQRLGEVERQIEQIGESIARLERQVRLSRKPSADPEAIVRALADNPPPQPAASAAARPDSTAIAADRPAAETAAVAEPVAAPDVEPEPGAEPVAEPVAAPADEPLAQPVAQAAAGPVVEPAIQQAIDRTLGRSNELQLSRLELTASAGDNRFRFSFTVTLPGNEGKQVVGTIWLAVNGLSNGRPVRLSLKQVSSQTRPYFEMRFRGQQDVATELTLPPGFEPENIAIEAKPFDDRYRGANAIYTWATGGQSLRAAP